MTSFTRKTDSIDNINGENRDLGLTGSQTGFTLIELMLTLTIVGIITSIALPSMNFVSKSSRVRTVSSDTHTSLLQARSEAIKRNSNITLNSTSGVDWSNGWSIKSGATDIGIQDPFLVDTVECYVNPTATTACAATLSFGRSGRASSYIEFRIYDSTNLNVPMRCVKVSLSGRPGVSVDSNHNPLDGCD